MITLTQNGKRQLAGFTSRHGDPVVRIHPGFGGDGPQQRQRALDDPKDGDQTFRVDGFSFVVAADVREYTSLPPSTDRSRVCGSSPGSIRRVFRMSVQDKYICGIFSGRYFCSASIRQIRR